MDVIFCGEQAQLSACYTKLGPLAVSKTTYIVGRDDIAQEIVHDVFLELWKNRKTFESETHLYKWVYRCCHNAALDYLRSYAKKNRAEFDTDCLPSSLPEQSIKTEQRQLIFKMLRHLTTEEAQVLAYQVLDEMTLEEIGELTQKSTKTVQRILGRVQQKFSEHRLHLEVRPI